MNMQYVLASVRANVVRSLLTVFTVAVAFCLWVLIVSLNNAISNGGVSLDGLDRIIVTHKASYSQPLPLAYVAIIANQEGALVAGHATGVAASHADSLEALPIVAVSAREYIQVYPEIVVEDVQLNTWLKNKEGALIGRDVALRHGMKVGDSIPFRSSLWRRADGAGIWKVSVSGIFDTSAKDVQTNAIFIHYNLLNDSRLSQKNTVGVIAAKVQEDVPPEVFALKIDQFFANSSAETKTVSEITFIRSFVAHFEKIAQALFVFAVMVFLIMLLVVGAVFLRSVYERENHFFAFNAMGYHHHLIYQMAVSECGFLVFFGALFGVGGAVYLTHALNASVGHLVGTMSLDLSDMLLLIALVVAFFASSIVLPIVRISRASALQFRKR